MHTDPQDLSALEARLSSWRPARDGLSPEALLFAAGQNAASRRGPRLAWPIACAALALLCAGLAIGFQRERDGRLALEARLRDASPALAPQDTPAPNSEDRPPGYLAMRQLVVERGVDAWPAVEPGPTVPPEPPHPIYHVGQRDGLMEP
jgi:hypothetical protein